jgi:hypothetical protein
VVSLSKWIRESLHNIRNFAIHHDFVPNYREVWDDDTQPEQLEEIGLTARPSC